MPSVDPPTFWLPEFAPINKLLLSEDDRTSRVATPPTFLTTKAGDTFTYSCTYQNPTNMAVTVGETAARNEMCMAIGYFFPAPASGGGGLGTMCN